MSSLSAQPSHINTPRRKTASQQQLRRGAAVPLLLAGNTAEPGGDAAEVLGFLLWMAAVAPLLPSLLAAGNQRRHLLQRRLPRCAAVSMVFGASSLVHGIQEADGDANGYYALLAARGFLLWMLGVLLLTLSFTSVGNHRRHLPQCLRRRCAAVLMLFSASFLVHGITEASANANHYYVVMAGCSFLAWMAGVLLLLFSFLAQFDEQPEVLDHQRLLRGCAAASMVLAASVLVHGIPESDVNAGHYVMAACFFLLWVAGAALLLLSFLLY